MRGQGSAAGNEEVRLGGGPVQIFLKSSARKISKETGRSVTSFIVAFCFTGVIKTTKSSPEVSRVLPLVTLLFMSS